MPDLTFVMQAFATLFVIVDPIGNVPVFIGLMEGIRREKRVAMTKMAVAIACGVLLIFTFFGNLIFRFLGISMSSFRIAGGILLLIISVEMLFGSRSRTEVSEEMMVEKEEDLTVSPLAVPLLTGPGAITSGIMLFDGAQSAADKAALCAVVLVVFALSYAILRNMELVYRTLGKTGTKVLVRLMGLMLSAIALQYIIVGAKEAFPLLA